MNARQRNVHIDALRGLAVLLMVLVHAAATWEPQLSGPWLMFGVVVSGAGGLAAPLFAALLGWGLYQRQLLFKQRIWRAACLFGCQGVVNLSAPHLFDPWTPGVLTLLGVLVLLEGVWRQAFQRFENPVKVFAGLGVALLVSTHVLRGIQGPSIWIERVVVADPVEWGQHLVLTGLYPLFPWILFAVFGTAVAACTDEQRAQLLNRTMVFGVGVSSLFLIESWRADVPWALPTGNAYLTFFPANAAFLIAALAGAALLWKMTETIDAFQVLADLGQVSLTVYVVHFLPFAWFHRADELQNWAPVLTVVVVVGYTLLWTALGTLWRRKAPGITLERWMRRLEPK